MAKPIQFDAAVYTLAISLSMLLLSPTLLFQQSNASILGVLLMLVGFIGLVVGWALLWKGKNNQWFKLSLTLLIIYTLYRFLALSMGDVFENWLTQTNLKSKVVHKEFQSVDEVQIYFSDCKEDFENLLKLFKDKPFGYYTPYYNGNEVEYKHDGSFESVIFTPTSPKFRLLNVKVDANVVFFQVHAETPMGVVYLYEDDSSRSDRYFYLTQRMVVKGYYQEQHFYVFVKNPDKGNGR